MIGAVTGIVLLGVGLGLLNARGTYMPGWFETADGGLVPSGTYVLNRDLSVVPNVVTAAWWPALLAIAVVVVAAAVAAVESGEEAINHRTLSMADYIGPSERRRQFERELM